MITIKNKLAVKKMFHAGQELADIFCSLQNIIVPGISTLEIDAYIQKELKQKGMVSQSKGYKGYKHVSCISVNDTVVHGIPSKACIVKHNDLVKVDVCAAYSGYCADMARCFVVGEGDPSINHLINAAQAALDSGIKKTVAGNKLTDISAAIQQEIEKFGYGIVREFAGHGIGKHMHEEPEVLNYGKPGVGPILRPGMAFAIEPMITMGDYKVYIESDGWTVKTKDKSLAAHVEDTVIVTEHGPMIVTRKNCMVGLG
jgi:methionyl aminopeptidase